MLDIDNAKNFTPHPVTIFFPDGSTKEYPSVGNCRAESRQRCAGEWAADENEIWEAPNWAGRQHVRVVPLMRPPEMDGVSWVPHAPQGNETVIVSIVAAPVVVAEQPDLTVLVPDTGPDSAVRDESGRIRGVRRLILWHDPEEAARPAKLVECWNPNPAEGWTLRARFAGTVDGIVEALIAASKSPRLFVVYDSYPPARPQDGFAEAPVHADTGASKRSMAKQWAAAWELS